MNYLEKARDFLRSRKQNYHRTFDNPPGQKVLADLARFCRAHETCVVPGNDDAGKVLEGRREVWLRIQQHLQLSDEELWALYSAPGKKEPQ